VPMRVCCAASAAAMLLLIGGYSAACSVILRMLCRVRELCTECALLGFLCDLTCAMLHVTRDHSHSDQGSFSCSLSGSTAACRVQLWAWFT
jgi:hypothetical protein